MFILCYIFCSFMSFLAQSRMFFRICRFCVGKGALCVFCHLSSPEISTLIRKPNISKTCISSHVFIIYVVYRRNDLNFPTFSFCVGTRCSVQSQINYLSKKICDFSKKIAARRNYLLSKENSESRNYVFWVAYQGINAIFIRHRGFSWRQGILEDALEAMRECKYFLSAKICQNFHIFEFIACGAGCLSFETSFAILAYHTRLHCMFLLSA